MEARKKKEKVSVGRLTLDRLRYEVWIGSQEIRLTPKEFELLWTLASSSGRVFHREELLLRVWGAEVFVDLRTVDAHVKRIRQKLDAVPKALIGIETVWGIGYRLNPYNSIRRRACLNPSPTKDEKRPKDWLRTAQESAHLQIRLAKHSRAMGTGR